MPLPIATGGLSFSSEQLRAPFQPIFTALSSANKSESQECEKHFVRQTPYQSVAWAVCPFNEWQARIVLSFYDDVNDSSSKSRKRRRMVDIRVQISPLVRALSTKAYRETRYHLELFSWYDDCRGDDIAGDNEKNNGNDSISSSESWDDCSSEKNNNNEYLSQRKETQRQPQVVFSGDRRYIMVLLFDEKNYCSDQKYRQRNHQAGKQQQKHSAIIVFQLRQPQSSTEYSIDDRNKIPLPSYIANASTNSSETGTDIELNIHPNRFSSYKGSAVVATHPKFVPSCEGITAICRIAGESTKSFVSRRDPAPHSPIFLAARNDGTLNWVDPKNVQIIATAAVPQMNFENRFVASMTASPNSTLESGMVALIIASSHSTISLSESSSDLSESLTSYGIDDAEDSVDDVDDSFETISGFESGENRYSTLVKKGDCVLVKWSLSSTTDDSLLASRYDGSQIPNESDKDGDKPNVADIEEQEDLFRRKEHMDQFVLQELQKKRQSSTQQSLTSDSVKAQNDFVPADRPSLVVFSGSIFSRQYSTFSNENAPVVSSMMMHVELLSKWSPPSNGIENTDTVITEVCFGSIPTVLCVVYNETNRDTSSSPRQKMAQILTLSDNGMSGNKGSILILPAVSLYLSLDQVEHAPSVARMDQNNNEDYSHCDYDDEGYRSSDWNANSDVSSSDVQSHDGSSERNFKMIEQSQLFGIQHDPSSDSFIISSIFRGKRSNKDFWVGCVWNWRANAIGWMVQHEVPTMAFPSSRKSAENSNNAISVSRLYIGRVSRNGGGSYLVYINSSSRSDSTIANGNGQPPDYNNSAIFEARKSIVPAAIISPSNSLSSGVFTERSSLLLAEQRVSFPSVAPKDADINVRELDWKISALPLSYITSQGPPLIAAMGNTQAKSIAVASARGVCVMDTYQNKWKQFGSPMEERSFSIVSMTWWEGSPNRGKDHEREDLLVAITQNNSGEQFLSCWSSKR